MASVATIQQPVNASVQPGQAEPRHTCYLLVDEIIELLLPHVSKLRAMGVTSMAVFGSRAEYRHRPDSDLDLLIDYDPSKRFSLLDLVGAQQYVHDLIGCDVQMTTRDSLRPSSIEAIRPQLIEVY